MILIIFALYKYHIRMRSLSKPAKIKKNEEKGQKHQNKTGKMESKKVMKTIFHSPFRYKIQTLSSEDCESVLSALVIFLKNIRPDMGVEVKRINNQKFINFNSKVKQQRPVLITSQLTYGVKQCISNIKKNSELIKLIIFFYDEKKHDVFEELMCYSIYNKIPYIVMKENQVIKAELGLKKLLSLGVLHQELANSLSAYCCRCLIEIPWLVQHQWIPISNNSQKALNELDQ